MTLDTTAAEADVEGFLTYRGWGRHHHICAGPDPGDGAEDELEDNAAIGNLSDACSLLAYR